MGEIEVFESTKAAKRPLQISLVSVGLRIPYLWMSPDLFDCLCGFSDRLGGTVAGF